MADLNISPVVESWRIANLTPFDFGGFPDVPGLSGSGKLPPLDRYGNPVWIEALDFIASSDLLAASDNFRNALISNPPSVATEGYKHTHIGLYDASLRGETLPDATTWHSHNGLSVLTAGPSSNADSLHTHTSFITETTVNSLISDAIDGLDLSGYVEKDGSITQLSDITSSGAVIEAAVAQAHPQAHTLLEHLDSDPVTIANLIKLFDGSNADCCHTHSNLGGGTFDGEHNELDGLNDGDYIHLTAAEYSNFGTLTDGSNADGLHVHSISSSSDVNISSVSSGDILSWNSSNNKWENIAASISGVHNDLEGLQGGSFLDPSNDEYYHLEYNQYITLIGGPSVNADEYHTHAGLVLDHNSMDGLQGGNSSDNEYYHLDYNQYLGLIGGPSVNADEYHTHEWPTVKNGLIYINDIQPQPVGGGNVGDKVYLSGSNDEILISCSADDIDIRVYVIAMIGPSNLRPSVTVNGITVGNWDYAAYASDNRVLFRGYADITLVGETVTATHEDGATVSCTVTADTPPVISSVTFTGTYPGSQIEYKAVDTVGMTVTADITFDQIEVENSGSCDYQLVTGFSGTTRAWTANIADRGNTRESYPARVRVRKPSGTWSAWVYTNYSASVDHINNVYLNNLYPSVGTMTQGSITYPVGQQGIKGTETVSIVCVCSDYTSILYSDPTGNELTIPNTTTYQSPKLSVAGRASGNYNISSTNYRVSCNRLQNNATTTKNLVVYVADLPLTVTMSEASRLRTGGNDGTAAQNHTITMTCNQRVLSTSIPTIGAASPNGGTWSGSFSGGPTTFTRTLIVDESDGDLPATYTYQALSVFNLANTETTAYTGDSNYVIGGFVTRGITLAAFANESTFNAAVADYTTKCTLSWPPKALPNKRAFNTTAVPDANSWCFAGTIGASPTTVRILDIGATNASSDATIITVEETI